MCKYYAGNLPHDGAKLFNIYIWRVCVYHGGIHNVYHVCVCVGSTLRTNYGVVVCNWIVVSTAYNVVG